MCVIHPCSIHEFQVVYVFVTFRGLELWPKWKCNIPPQQPTEDPAMHHTRVHPLHDIIASVLCDNVKGLSESSGRSKPQICRKSFVIPHHCGQDLCHSRCLPSNHQWFSTAATGWGPLPFPLACWWPWALLRGDSTTLQGLQSGFVGRSQLSAPKLGGLNRWNPFQQKTWKIGGLDLNIHHEGFCGGGDKKTGCLPLKSSPGASVFTRKADCQSWIYDIACQLAYDAVDPQKEPKFQKCSSSICHLCYSAT